jgi:hypothetical protein
MLTVLCPSRGRPDQARECYQSFLATIHNPDTKMYFVIDHDDSTRAAYEVRYMVVDPGRPGMADALNAAVARIWEVPGVIGFVGDDHRFRTSGWDEIFLAQLETAGGGLAFANDLARSDIPTQIFGSSQIWRALGWMALPGAQHLYLDNTWREIGERLDRLYYFPDIVIEHMHPTVGKGVWDEGYQTVNAPAMYDHDAKVYAAWLSERVDTDIERIRAAL